MDDQNQFVSSIRVRLSASDAHYGGQLVNGAHMLSLFGDVATELAILCDGDEALALISTLRLLKCWIHLLLLGVQSAQPW